MLPGITDDYHIGYKSPYRHLDRLTRVYEYMAPAWYQREISIPKEWEGKRIFMYFERVHWLSSIVVDDKEVSKIDYVSVPHNHELTDYVKPGRTGHLFPAFKGQSRKFADYRFGGNREKSWWQSGYIPYSALLSGCLFFSDRI